MKDYKIVGLHDHNITLEFDHRRVNFALPIVDGYYPEGDELHKILNAYVQRARETRNSKVVALNESSIIALVEGSKPREGSAVIAARNRLLKLTDWTQMPDVTISSSMKKSWSDYRQELRDMTSQIGFPHSVKWPIPPTKIKNVFGAEVTDDDGIPLNVARS